MQLSEKRMGEIALKFVELKIRTDEFFFDKFQNRVNITSSEIGISEEEAMSFAVEMLNRAEGPNTENALRNTSTEGSA